MPGRAGGIFGCIKAVGIFATILSFLLANSAQANSSGKDSLLRQFKQLRDGIDSQSYIETVHIEDKSSSGATKIHDRSVLVYYSRRDAKARHELLSQAPALSGKSADATFGYTVTGKGHVERDKIKVQIITSSEPQPSWLFSILRDIEKAKVTAVTGKEGTVIELCFPKQKRSGSAKTVVLNKRGLPIIVRALGYRGEVLDELTIEWSNEGKYAFPVGAELVQRSIRNTLITTVKYSAVSLNTAISASVFAAP